MGSVASRNVRLEAKLPRPEGLRRRCADMAAPRKLRVLLALAYLSCLLSCVAAWGSLVGVDHAKKSAIDDVVPTAAHQHGHKQRSDDAIVPPRLTTTVDSSGFLVPQVQPSQTSGTACFTAFGVLAAVGAITAGILYAITGT